MIVSAALRASLQTTPSHSHRTPLGSLRGLVVQEGVLSGTEVTSPGWHGLKGARGFNDRFNFLRVQCQGIASSDVLVVRGSSRRWAKMLKPRGAFTNWSVSHATVELLIRLD